MLKKNHNHKSHDTRSFYFRKTVFLLRMAAFVTLICLNIHDIAAGSGKCAESDAPLSFNAHEAVVNAEKSAEKGDYGSAATIISGFLDSNPGEAHSYLYYDLGYFLYKSGKSDNALNWLENAVKESPCFSDAWRLLAVILYEQGVYKNAADAMEKAASLSDNDEVKLQSAQFLVKAEKPEKAIKTLEKLLSKTSSDPNIYIAMAGARLAMKNPGLAAESMEKAAALSSDPDHLYQAALMWLEAQNPIKALPILKSLENRPSPRHEWLVALASTLEALKKKEETAMAMEKAARAGNSPDLFYRAAWLWMDAEKPEKALPLLQILMRKSTPDVNWLLLLSNVYMSLNRIKDAAEVMEQVVSEDPKADYLYHCGVLWLQASHSGKAIKYLLMLEKLPSPKAEWFAALAQAYILADNISKAADAMEKAAVISNNPEHAYHAAILRLQLKQAEKTLAILKPLLKLEKRKAEWNIAASNAWTMLEKYGNAAPEMERAAEISKKEDHWYQAAQLWLRNENPEKALPHLKRLATLPSPHVAWLLTLSNAFFELENMHDAAKIMEQAAVLSGNGDHYYRAAMLYRQEDDIDKTLLLLRAAVKVKPVKEVWRVELASVLMERSEVKEALYVLEKADLSHAGTPENVRYRGALLWLQCDHLHKALTVLESLCRSGKPEYNWLLTLAKTEMELEKSEAAEKNLAILLNLYPGKIGGWKLAVWAALQKQEYEKAAAAMEVCVRLDPSDNRMLDQLSRFYHMAGLPVPAVEAFRKTMAENPSAEEWDRLAELYMSGKRYALALTAAKKALESHESGERWETIGDITLRLHCYKESAEAYLKGAAISQTPGIYMKAGYAFMKIWDHNTAARYFNEVIEKYPTEGGMVDEAKSYLAYIDKIQIYTNSKAAKLEK